MSVRRLALMVGDIARGLIIGLFLVYAIHVVVLRDAAETVVRYAGY